MRTLLHGVSATLVVATGCAFGVGCAEGLEVVGESGAGGAAAGSSSGGAGPGGGGAGNSGNTGNMGNAGGSGNAGGTGGEAPTSQACPPGELATGVDEGGTLECAPPEADALAAINERCSVYAGWLDGCGACTTSPSKWGRAGGLSCQSGLGAGGTCAPHTLGSTSVFLYGLNTAGDVDDNDKFHVGLSCDEGPTSPTPGPCAAGEFVDGFSPDGAPHCVPLADAVAAYVNDHCELYFGWRDGCGSCGLAPTLWGSVGAASCQNGAGASNTCTTPTLGGTAVQLFGLATGGDVDDNDKLYYALHCDPATPASSSASGNCPPGQLVVGIHGDGTVECESPAPVAEAVFAQSCHVYAGWRDGCAGTCTSPPSRWGRARVGGCENGLGATNTCTTAALGGVTVNLFGLNTGGDVDENDRFYYGLRCQ